MTKIISDIFFRGMVILAVICLLLGCLSIISAEKINSTKINGTKISENLLIIPLIFTGGSAGGNGSCSFQLY